MKSKGFTLIELLVVIAIIGMLSSIVLASLNSSRVKARDALRREELKQLSNASELYAGDHSGNYPGVIGSFSNIHVGNSLTNFMVGYISTIQDDPLWPNQTYLYMNKSWTGDWACETVNSTINSATKYAFYATLENPTSADTATLSDAYDQCVALHTGSNYRIGN